MDIEKVVGLTGDDLKQVCDAYHEIKSNEEIQNLREQLANGKRLLLEQMELTNERTKLCIELRAKVASAEVLVGALREAKLALLSGVLPYESVRIIEKAIAKYEKLSEVKHD